MNRLTVAYTGALLMLALGCKDLNLGPKDQSRTLRSGRVRTSSSWPPMISTSRCAALTRGGCTRYLRRAQFRYRHRQRELGDVIDEQRVRICHRRIRRLTMHMPDRRPLLLAKAHAIGTGIANRSLGRRALSSGRITTGNLVKKYGGVPSSPRARRHSREVYSPRATQQEIIDFIIADLDARCRTRQAESAAPKEMGRVTQGAAPRAEGPGPALYQGTWLRYHQRRAHPRDDYGIDQCGEQLIASNEYIV